MQATAGQATAGAAPKKRKRCGREARSVIGKVSMGECFGLQDGGVWWGRPNFREETTRTP